MGAATAIITGVSALGSLASTIDGRNRASKAERAAEKYTRQDLGNPFSNLQVSTLGANLQREELARNNASTLNALQQGGSRALVSGLPSVLNYNNQMSGQIAANLDNQLRENQLSEAEGEFKFMQMNEQRENQDLSGIAREREAGIQQKWDGISNAIQSGIGGVSAYTFMKSLSPYQSSNFIKNNKNFVDTSDMLIPNNISTYNPSLPKNLVTTNPNEINIWKFPRVWDRPF